MKLTVDSPIILPRSATPPEDFWEQHATEQAAKTPATLDEPESQ